MGKKRNDQIIELVDKLYGPHRVRSSHIVRFSSAVGSTVVGGVSATDNAGGIAGSGRGGGIGKGSFGGAGGPVRGVDRELMES